MSGAPVKRKEDPRLITGSSVYVDDSLSRAWSTWRSCAVRTPTPGSRVSTRPRRASHAGRRRGGDGAGSRSPADRQVPGRGLRGTRRAAGGADRGSEEATTIPVPGVEPLARTQGALHRRAGRRGGRRDARCRPRTPPPRSRSITNRCEAVVDPYEARQPGAPQLYDNVKNNISVRQETVHGDVDAALAAAPVKVKAKIRAAALPSRCRWRRAASVAAPDPITRGLTIWTSNQGPHGFRNEIASAFGLGQNQVRAIAPEVGGGFGCKFGAYHEDFIAAALALKLNRPVKWIETPQRALPGHQPRSQPVGRVRGRRRRGRPHPGAARAGLARFRRLSQGARTWPGAPG